jgi:hypothetical protein
MEDVEYEEEEVPQGNNVEVMVLNSLKAGESPFTAWSKSRLAVSRGGKKIILEVPIKSIGMADVMERIAANAPVPPRQVKVVKKNSPEGRAAGYQHDTMSYVEDNMDPEYQKQLREYEMRSTYSLVLHGLAMDIFDSDGTTALVKANDLHTATQVINEEKAILVLKQSGLTGEHLRKLADDVRQLTQMEEARIDRE